MKLLHTKQISYLKNDHIIKSTGNAHAIIVHINQSLDKYQDLYTFDSCKRNSAAALLDIIFPQFVLTFLGHGENIKSTNINNVDTILQ